MKNESSWKYTPILLFRPDIHSYDFPRMKPSYPKPVESKEDTYLVSSSTLRCMLIGKTIFTARLE